MKIMFISDIHGSYIYAKKALEMYELEKADKLVIFYIMDHEMICQMYMRLKK